MKNIIYYLSYKFGAYALFSIARLSLKQSKCIKTVQLKKMLIRYTEKVS